MWALLEEEMGFSGRKQGLETEGSLRGPGSIFYPVDGGKSLYSGK